MVLEYGMAHLSPHPRARPGVGAPVQAPGGGVLLSGYTPGFCVFSLFFLFPLPSVFALILWMLWV